MHRAPALSWTRRRRFPLAIGPLVIGLALMPASVATALNLAYSFEDDLQGFGPNGAGITITQDTIGATEGTQSMKVDIVQGATFVGALADVGTIPNEFIGDPPGIESVVFDLTIEEQFPQDEGFFLQAGITVFGSSQPDFVGGLFEGLSIQFFEDEVPLQDLEAGTHEVRIDLTSAPHPLTFETGLSFNEIVGTEGSGEFDIIPTGFQIYISKSANSPWTGYIDNIRVGTVADTVEGDFSGDGSVDNTDLNLLLNNWGSDTVPPEWVNGFISPVNNDELNALLNNWGAGTSAVPEPATLALAAIALASVHSAARRQAR